MTRFAREFTCGHNDGVVEFRRVATTATRIYKEVRDQLTDGRSGPPLQHEGAAVYSEFRVELDEHVRTWPAVFERAEALLLGDGWNAVRVTTIHGRVGVRLARLHDNVLVVPTIGPSFPITFKIPEESHAFAQVSGESLMQDVMANGAWCYDSGDSVFIPAAQIAAIRWDRSKEG